jgi:hypothetical protein
MILVPGVPLINGVRDTIGNHIGNGIARLLFGTVTVLAIAFGLFLAAGIAGDTLPVGAHFPALPLAQDLLFSALAGAAMRCCSTSRRGSPGHAACAPWPGMGRARR